MRIALSPEEKVAGSETHTQFWKYSPRDSKERGKREDLGMAEPEGIE